MRDYTELLTEQEIDNIVAQLRAGGSNTDNVVDALKLFAFYVECKVIADGVLAGDFVITGVGEGGLEYRLSEKAKRRLH